jgi:hypothetical protein
LEYIVSIQPVTELNLKCTFPIEQRLSFDRIQQSPCGAPATSAVFEPTTWDRHWRCAKHTGQYRENVPGVTAETVSRP